jgi:hypothetical protein
MALLLAAGLGLTVSVLNGIRRPHTHRAREAAGLCVECGYDLRASADRCPECNAPLPESVTRRRRIAAEIRANRGPSRGGPADAASQTQVKNSGATQSSDRADEKVTNEELRRENVRPAAAPPRAD